MNKLVEELLTDYNCKYDGNKYLQNSDISLQLEIKNIANSLSISLLNENSKNYLMWDGKYLRYKQLTVANILHDIAHFQIALPINRYLPDFGLSLGPDSNFKLDIKIEEIPTKNCVHHKQNKLFLNWDKYTNLFGTHGLQEIFSSMLGILWCRKLKIFTKKILCEHDWCHILTDCILDEKYIPDFILNNEKFIFNNIDSFFDVIKDLQKNQFLDENCYPTFKLNN